MNYIGYIYNSFTKILQTKHLDASQEKLLNVINELLKSFFVTSDYNIFLICSYIKLPQKMRFII